MEVVLGDRPVGDRHLLRHCVGRFLKPQPTLFLKALGQRRLAGAGEPLQHDEDHLTPQIPAFGI
mgnify:CR=1 FL=1